MNECLPHATVSVNEPDGGAPRVMTDPPRPESGPRGGVDVFTRALAGDPDLAELTPAARRVLAMAAALFYQRGAVATSVRDITSACGLTPGALYNHFPSKDDLLAVLVKHGHDRLDRRIAAALAGVGDDPVARFEAFVRGYVMGHLVHPELAQVVRREYLHLSPARHEDIVRRRRLIRRQLADVLRDGTARGAFDLIGGPDAPTRVAVMILDMCSRTSEWYDPSHAEGPDELAERYVAAAKRLAGARSVPAT
jgi:AcrR family transcriptional regulator